MQIRKQFRKGNLSHGLRNWTQKLETGVRMAAVSCPVFQDALEFVLNPAIALCEVHPDAMYLQ